MVRHRPPKTPVKVSDWHRADIKAALERAGWTVRGLARHHDVHHTALSLAFESPYPCDEEVLRKIEKRVCELKAGLQ